MSLGFNHNRKQRSSTLPGTVNPQFIRDRRAPSTSIATAATRRKSPPTPPIPLIAPTKTEAPAAPPANDEIHVVYATVAAPLCDEKDGQVVAEIGSRVVLAYPMFSDAEDGRITMKLKRINSNTAQLSYSVVTVYDPNTETRHVTDFSLIP